LTIADGELPMADDELTMAGGRFSIGFQSSIDKQKSTIK